MLVQLDVRNRIGYLTLNRPDALNAINQPLMDDLEAALHSVASDENVVVLIVTGAGQAFCAGSDIKDLDGVSPAEAERIVRREADICHLFEEIPQPTIAAVNGHALGGGAALMLYQNIRVAGETAVFGFPGVTLGWNPAFGMSRLRRLVGRGWASELMLTGRTISAREALDIRMVDHVVPTEELMARAEDIAGQIAGNPTVGVRAIKTILQEEEYLPPDEADDYELRVFGKCIETEDAQDSIKAFVEKKNRQ